MPLQDVQLFGPAPLQRQQVGSQAPQLVVHVTVVVF